MTSKKNPTDGKKDITHINTAYYAVKPKAIDLPEGTLVRSSHGVNFIVVSCAKRTPYRFFVIGSPTSHLNCADPHIVAGKNLILTGVVWPSDGWKITFMPGFTEHPPLT